MITFGKLRKDRKAKVSKVVTQKKRSRLLADISGNQAASVAKSQQTKSRQEGKKSLPVEAVSPATGNAQLAAPELTLACAVQALADKAVTIDPDILPRTQRRTKRAKEDRGLPPDEQLRELATAYLTTQRQYWSKLAGTDALPEPTADVIQQMVEDFKHRHRQGIADTSIIAVFVAIKLKLGGGYCRFSCDNSNPTSILDQMERWLRRSHSDGIFVPWCNIFADYSVSGLLSSRQGYSSYKKALSDKSHSIEVTYIDDFSRASRDELEWWKLAQLSKRLGKGLIGASDSFDLHSEHADLLMGMFNLLSKLFIKSLRQKVKRGMAGTNQRRGVLGKLPLGITRKLKRDAAGNVVYRANGKPAHEPCIDPATKKWVVEMLELFVEHKKTPGWIARRFTALKVEDWQGWTRGFA